MKRINHPIASLVLGGTLVLLLAACSSDGGGGHEPHATRTASPTVTDAIDISDLAFSPASVTVPAGSTVTWTNHDIPPHDVTFADGEQSEQLVNGATYQRTFEEAGSFDYVCSIHPQMTGRVIVTAKPEASMSSSANSSAAALRP
jgi:plastocyanin